MASSGSGGPPSRVWDPNSMYDVTLEERRAIEERGRMRSELRKEWQKKVTNPYRGATGHIFDPAIQRFMSMKATQWDQFKATPKNAAFGFAFGVLPIGLFWYLIARDKRNLEHKCRTGQISYADRDWKFV